MNATVAGPVVTATPTNRAAVLPPIQRADEQGHVAQPGQVSTDGNQTSQRESQDGRSSSSARNRPLTFKEVGAAVKLSLKVAGGFSTLRDMGGADVAAAELRPVRKLGEGAFAVVEEALYTPQGSSGSSSPEGDGAAAGDGSGSVAAGGSGDAAAKASAEGSGAAGRSKAAAAPRRVAVKRLKPEIVNHEGDLASFLSEIQLLRKLAHKRIVEYIGVGSSDTSCEAAKRRSMFLVQEFMDGGTLKRLVGRQMLAMSKQLYSAQDAFRWATHVAEGLEYLHTSRPVVIHRDLKLENILLKGTDPYTAEAKIVDFGLVALVQPRVRGLHEQLHAAQEAHVRAQLEQQRQHSVGWSSFQRLLSGRKQAALTPQEVWDRSFKVAQLTRARTLPPQQLSGRTGSYMYMAPEMYRQEAYSEKVDVFSYGVIIFELFSRYQMVCAVSLAGTEAEIESYAARVSGGYRPPLPPSWPEPLRQLIAACWQQDPAQRPNMTAVKSALLKMQAEGVPEEMQAASAQPMCACTIC